MAFRYYYADRVRELMPEYKGTDEELQEAIDDINLLYNAAMKELEARIQVLSEEFDKKNSYMPIHHVQSRLKTIPSILEKSVRYGIEDPVNNLDVVKREILDIAGIRVVCNYEEDLHTMSNILLEQEDINLIKVKDYCSNPKPSGYRSLHVVVAVPVYLLSGKRIVPVEIQFRSIAMDAWASLEHELRYKNKGTISEENANTLKECADTLHEVDERLSRIRYEILRSDSKYSNY